MSKLSKAQKWASATAPDPILSFHVRVANEATDDLTGTYVTLTVHGTVVTGEIVPNWVWAEALHKAVTATHHEERSGYSVWRDEMIKVRDERLPENESADEDTSTDGPNDEAHLAWVRDTPTFIHLRNAQVFLGHNPAPSKGDGLWRGRLASVDGWFLGQYKINAEAS